MPLARGMTLLALMLALSMQTYPDAVQAADAVRRADRAAADAMYAAGEMTGGRVSEDVCAALNVSVFAQRDQVPLLVDARANVTEAERILSGVIYSEFSEQARVAEVALEQLTRTIRLLEEAERLNVQARRPLQALDGTCILIR